MARNEIDNLWDRLRNNLAFRVGTIYAGGSWFLVQAADTLGGSGAVVRGLALALAAGFVVVVPVAWLVDRRSRSAEAELVDGHWGIGTRVSRHILSRTGTRRWVATLVVLAVLAGALWVGGTRLYGSPVPEAATKIAVLPFQGSGSTSAREFGVGIVDLLSAALDNVGEIRTVSARTILARTGTEPGTAPSLETALDIGSDVGAGSILTGSITSVGGTVRLTGEIRSLADTAVLAVASAEGTENGILSLTDELAVALVRDMWRSREPLPTVSTAGLLTTSPAALREYMRGERLLRGLQFDSASAAFRAATTADTAFALAWTRLAESTGWGQEIETVFERRGYADNAVRHAARLPVRERMLVNGVQLKLQGAFAAADSIADYVRRYPDDPYGWYLLGDTRYHDMHLGLFTEAEVIDPFLEAARLDPSFALGLTHIIDHAIESGDREQFDALMADYARVAPADEIAQLEAAARLRWAPGDSVLPVFISEISSLRSVEDRRTVNRLANVLGDRTRLDPTVDPDVYIEAFDSSRVLFASDRAWQQTAMANATNATFAFGRAARGFERVDEQIARGIAFPPAIPQDIRGSLIRVMAAISSDLPMTMVREDVERIEARPPMNVLVPTVLHIYWTKAGDPERAERYDVDVANPPDVPPIDTAGTRLVLQGWEAALRGDGPAAIAMIEDGFHRLGTNDMWAIDPVVFEFARLLSEQPDRRTQGIRMLRWFTRNRAAEAGRAYLALGRALEAEGDAAGAREAYGHVLRLWADADDYLDDEVDMARRALERLTRETG